MSKIINIVKTHKGKSILLVLIAFLVYFNTLKNGFVLDDDVVYLQNRFVQAGTDGIKDIFSNGFLFGYNGKNDQSYRPLVLLNFAIEHELFGNNPKVHHFFNILFYCLISFLVYKLLLWLFNEQEKWLAFWVALVFVVHPIHTEVVANIKGRDDLLHVIFYLLSFIYGLKYIDRGEKKHLVYALTSLFLAALCKEIAITFLALFPVAIYVFREKSVVASLKASLWFLVPIGAYFLLRNQILDTIAFEEKMSIINNGIAAGSNFNEQLGITFSIFAKYIQLLFFPYPLSWDYSYPYFPIVSLFNPKILVFAILVLLTIVWSIFAILKHKNKIAFGVLFFLITFSIVSNFFILIGATLGERFLFLPSLGFAIVFVLLIQLLIQNIGVKPKQYKNYLAAFVLIVSLLFSLKTIDRNKEWENNATLFESGYEATPTSSRSVLAYASVFRERGEVASDMNVRLSNFNKAIELYQESLRLHDTVSDSWYNLGICYMGINKPEQARQAYLKTLEIDANQINALNNLGVIYFQAKNYPEAKKYFSKCLEINNQFASAYANLGAVNHNQGNLEEAKKYYLEALRLNPNDQNTRSNLSKL